MLNSSPKFNSLDAAIVASDMYDINYNIFDHSTKAATHPLATVTLHEAEENSQTSQLESVIQMYRERNIKTLFGLSLIEYLSLPSEYCLMLINGANAQAQKDAAVAAQIAREMGTGTPKK